ncbi:MAG: hypothetical protein D3906_18580, partial [Candidatus Electrothrix sp. AUS1_2]|nr:hypothetical protein [Candidatus Electrothrix sp. AUS1_2]
RLTCWWVQTTAGKLQFWKLFICLNLVAMQQYCFPSSLEEESGFKVKSEHIVMRKEICAACFMDLS